MDLCGPCERIKNRDARPLLSGEIKARKSKSHSFRISDRSVGGNGMGERHEHFFMVIVEIGKNYKYY